MKATIRTALTALAASALVLLSIPAVQADTIYKWVDDKGIAQFGSRPPPGKEDSAKLIKGQSRVASRRPQGDEADAEGGDEEAGAAVDTDVNVDVDATDDTDTAEAGAGEPAPAPAEPESKLDQESASLEAKVKAHNCAKGRETLKVLNENARVRVKNEKGEYVFLSTPQMEERKVQAQQVIQENC